MSENTALVTVTRELAVADWAAKTAELIGRAAEVIAVDDDKDLSASSQIQSDLGKQIKTLAKARMDLTRPLDEIKKDIMAQEKTLAGPAEQQIARLRRLGSEYATRIAAEAERRRQEEIRAERERQQAAAERQAKAEALFGRGTTIREQPPAPVVNMAPVAPAEKVSTGGGGRVVEVWDFAVTDATAVPRDFCTPNESAIRLWMNSQVKLGRAPEMPGVAFSRRMDIRAR